MELSEDLQRSGLAVGGIVAVDEHAHGVVLLRPDREVEDGSTVA